MLLHMPLCMRNPQTLNIIVTIEACFASLYCLAAISGVQDGACYLKKPCFVFFRPPGFSLQTFDSDWENNSNSWPTILLQTHHPHSIWKSESLLIYLTRKCLHIAGLNLQAGYTTVTNDLLANLLYYDKRYVTPH